MKWKVLPVGLYEANCSLIWDENKNTLIVDPGSDADEIIATIQAENLSPVAIFLTHGHFDHISAVDDLLASFQVPVYLSESDRVMTFMPFNLSQPGYPAIASTTPLTFLNNPLTIPEFPQATILPTPGHSAGSLCLYFPNDNLLIAGDTLFAGSIGRTDLPSGSFREIKQSLAEITKLPLETTVICGHGPSTTIACELQNNPYLS